MTDTFAYSDGADIENQVIDYLKSSPSVRSDHLFPDAMRRGWPYTYHLSPERSTLLRHLTFNGLDVLELGAGMGAVSRLLAEQAASLHVVEGSQRRYTALTERLRDRTNWTGTVANLYEFSTERKFHVVCIVGVLEYALAFAPKSLGFTTPEQAVLHALARATELLSDDGVLIVAIENKVGLKYFNGAPEDHTDRMYDSISGYVAASGVMTYSRQQWLGLFASAGFSDVREYYPFPDYKFARSVLTREFVEEKPSKAAEIAGSYEFLNHGTHIRPNFPSALGMQTIAQAGLLKELANSFLFVAARHEASAVRDALLARERTGRERGWHYSMLRKDPARTIIARADDASWLVRKELIQKPDANELHDPDSGLIWRRPDPVALFDASPLSLGLVRAVYYGQYDELRDTLNRFLSWAMARFSMPENDGFLKADYLDALFSNTLDTPEGFALFDLEWHTTEPVAKNTFIFRNVIQLGILLGHLIPDRSPWSCMQDLYLELCATHGLDPESERCIRMEAALQSAVSGRSEADCLEGVRRQMDEPFTATLFPLRPTVEYERATTFDRVRQERDEAQNTVFHMRSSRFWKAQETWMAVKKQILRKPF